MTERDMFEKSFQRPRNFGNLSMSEQYDIDKALGILDWRGVDLTEKDKERYWKHYEK